MASLRLTYKKAGIGAIFCLQEPGEHPFCGEGIHKSSGLSYLPEEFYTHEISFYNFGWRDFQTTDIVTLMKIVKTMDFELSKSKKVAVHCHAGKGRTALVICAYLIYVNRYDYNTAIQIFRSKRPKSMKKSDQIKTLKLFEEYVSHNNQNYFVGKEFHSIVECENLLKREHSSMIINRLPEFVKAYFHRIKELGTKFTPDEILQSIYMVPDEQKLESKMQKYRILSMNSNSVREVLHTIEDPLILSQLFLEFLETLNGACIKPVSLANMKFLMNNHEIFENNTWKNNYLLSRKKINESEMILLIKINKFYRRMTDYSSKNYQFSLVRIMIALLHLRSNLESHFDGLTLKDVSIEDNVEVKTLRSFLEFLKSSKDKCSTVKENLSIINSPLRNFSINKRNKSAFSKRYDVDTRNESNNISQIFDKFTELDPNSKQKLYTRIKDTVVIGESKPSHPTLI